MVCSIGKQYTEPNALYLSTWVGPTLILPQYLEHAKPFGHMLKCQGERVNFSMKSVYPKVNLQSLRGIVKTITIVNGITIKSISCGYTY